jgi:pyrroline-5-carboxylate reductase
MNQSIKVAVFGCGVMGEALIAAILKSSLPPTSIAIVDKNIGRLTELRNKYGSLIASSMEISLRAENIFLAVKPQDIEVLLEEVGGLVTKNQRVISFAAGKKTSLIERYLNGSVPVIRVMPNTPMSVGVGASAISGGKHASLSDIKVVEDLLSASGKTIVVDESLQDAVTATSGSGPAYFFRFVEAMIAGAKDLGLSDSDARALVLQTINGAAAMLSVEGTSPSILRENVTSPNGTTFAALKVFEESGLEEIVKKAMTAARDRSRELS